MKKTNMNSKERKRSKNVWGNIFLVLQLIISVILLGTMYLMNIFSFNHFVAIGVVLLILWLIGLLSQIRRKKHGIIGKIYIILVTLILSLGSYYLAKVTGALEVITGNNVKVDTMVVAVLKNDPATDIYDAYNYKYGVQYRVNSEDMEETIDHINEKIGMDIKTKDYQEINKQVKALFDKEVKAIIYNEGYQSILDEEFEGYSDKVKIIYQYNIKTKMDDMVSNVKVKEEPFSVYLSGIDVYGDISKNSRSDVNIIATINPKSHQILLISTPRDYFVEIPGVSKGKKDKLTHAGLYGVDVSIDTLSELYEMKIPFYARVNFTSLIEIVDQLGGLDVYSDAAFTTGWESGKEITVKKGMNHFNGEEALAFSRERKNLPDGDNARGRHQQAVITAMIKKMVSPSMLLRANGLINSVSGNVETNMSKSQLQALVKTQLNEGDSWNIASVSAEGEGKKAICYSAPRQELYVTEPDYKSVEKIIELVNRVEKGEILEDSEITE